MGKNDSIMVCRGFLTSDYLENIDASLNISAKWSWTINKNRSERRSRYCFSLDILSEQYNVLAIEKFLQIRNDIPLIRHGLIYCLSLNCS